MGIVHGCLELEEKVRAGTVLRYQTWSGEERTVLIEAVERNINNGRPGFDGVEVEIDEQGRALRVRSVAGHGVWGYADQITEIVRY